MTGVGPPWLFSACAAATVFCVMFAIGLGVTPGDLRRAWRPPGPMLRGLFAVLVAVPALALVIVRALHLPLPVQAGILLMAISPGAPVALRRSLAAGGHGAFAPSLQICVALLAVLSMPLSIAALEEVYGAHITVEPADVMQQVLVAQLIPLGLGNGRRARGRPSSRRPGARDSHGGGDRQRRPQSRARLIGGDAERGTATGRRDDPRLSRGLDPHGHPLRRMATPLRRCLTVVRLPSRDCWPEPN